MGQKNNAMNHYFRDKERFADLFNGVFFGGASMIQANDLTEIAGTYEQSMDGQQSTDTLKRKERIRDIEMMQKTGALFRLLTLENQQNINYIMPFRCMQYDVMEYERQIENLKKENEKAKDYTTNDEWLCKVKKDDRLAPVYTICIYHGEDEWDGPRSLRDMMDFGDDVDGMSVYFADYPLRLFCLNEQREFDAFHTEIKELFRLMQFRRDKKGLQKELRENPQCRKIGLETFEVLSVMLDAPRIWKEMAKNMQETSEKEECDMCQALQEWLEDERNEGRAEGIATGRAEGIAVIVKNMLLRGMSDEDICALAECEQKLVDEIRTQL